MEPAKDMETYIKDGQLKTKITNLRNWDKNPRAIKKEDFERLKKQIQELGQYKPILVTSDGEVLGGNMRLKAYQALGISRIWISVVDPKTEAEKLKYALSDNDRAGYYVDQDLAELIQEYGVEINLEDYKVDLGQALSLADVLNQFAPDIEEDEAPAVAEGEPESKLGEVYQLGRHKLYCGNTETDLDKLIVDNKVDVLLSDPPYGINLDSSFSGFPICWENQKLEHKFESSIKGDDKPFNATFLFNLGCKEVFLFGADYYANTLPDSGTKGTWYVWDKREEENFDKMLGSPFELCWGLQKRGKKIIRMRWASFLHGKATEGEQSKNRLHPTQKPIALMAYFIKDFSKEGDIILDPYGGSGSTLIACEQTNRTCYMMELDPKYCDVIRKRYENFVSNSKETANGKS